MKIKNWEAILWDCLEEMKKIPDWSIDCIIADIPYWTTACKWDVVIPFEPMWEQLNRIIKPNWAIVLFWSQPFTSALVMSNPKMYKQSLVWKKNIWSNFLNANRMHMAIHEDIIIFYKKYPTFNKQLIEWKPYLAVRKDKDDTWDCYGKINKRTTTENKWTRNPTTVLEFKVQRDGIHPTQKPVALIEYLIKTYTNEWETVLDFTAWSFTTAVACENTNRKWICIEKEENYYNIWIERIQWK